MLLPDHHWPRCAKCNKLVEKLTTEANWETCVYRVEVFCHGAKESMEIPRQVFFDSWVEGGVAFRDDPKLEEPIKDDSPIPLLQYLGGATG